MQTGDGIDLRGLSPQDDHELLLSGEEEGEEEEGGRKERKCFVPSIILNTFSPNN